MAGSDSQIVYKEMMFGFLLFQTLFNWNESPPKSPPGYKKYNRNIGKCPNCGSEKSGITYGSSGGGFQDKKVNQLFKALVRLSNRLSFDDQHWKPFYQLFSTDLIPERGKYQSMLKCHPSRYSTGKFHCCGAKIWHDFLKDPINKNLNAWNYYYFPTDTMLLNEWI
jgi:hypothetical protein